MTTTNEHTELEELIRKLKTAPADMLGTELEWLYVACREAAALLEECCATTQAQRQALKPLTDKQIAAVAVDADCVWLQKEYTCSFRAIVRATETAHGIKEQA